MNTMFEKCAVAGDITKAIDRRGCWSVAITVIGGTESTAVKLQSCETADGVFADYKELIPASEASADQYKGFVLDLYGAGKFIKVVGATMATAVLGDCEADVKKIAITAGEIPSGADLDNNVEETINVSTYTEPVEVLPTEGKDGMKKATVTLSNVPQIQSNKAQTIDVSQYTEPVEIEPTSPNDAMAKVVVTLSNIPSPSPSVGSVLRAHLTTSSPITAYYTLSESPSVGTAFTVCDTSNTFKKFIKVTVQEVKSTTYLLSDGKEVDKSESTTMNVTM